MLFEDTYNSIANISTGEFKDRGSTFIAIAYPVADQLTVKEIIGSVKKQHSKANHHCYAFRVGPGGEAFRFSDDREPSGSAGKPIFGVIRTNDLTNILIVVVRYFGGSLGVPGLINAYRTAAQIALQNAEVVIKPITEKYKITFGYDELKEISTILRLHDASVSGQKMEVQCEIIFEITKTKADTLLSKINNHHLLTGKFKIEPL